MQLTGAGLRVVIRLGVALLLLATHSALAQTITRPASDLLGALAVPMDQLDPRAIKLRIGAGTVYSAGLDINGFHKFSPLPFVSFEYRDRLAVDETQARLNFIPSNSELGRDGFRAGPMLRVDPGRGHISRNDLRGIGRVPVSLEAGAFASYTLGPSRIRLRLRQDITNGHGGTVGELDVRTGLYKSGNLGIGMESQAVWASQRYLQTFYGVNAVQAMNSGLPMYNLGAGFKDVNATFFGEYKFSPQWALLGAVQYVHLLDGAADSPITKARGAGNRVSVGLFVLYTFGHRKPAS